MRKSWSAILALVAIGVILFLVLRRHNRGAYPTTVIPGTWTWDVDLNSLGSGSFSDFFWEQIDGTNRNLVPKNGAVAAVAAAKDFDAVDSLRDELELRTGQTLDTYGSAVFAGDALDAVID